MEKNQGIDYFISCDWGTTNFRLRLVETQSLKVLQEITADQGIKALYQQFQQHHDSDREGFFAQYLLDQIQNLHSAHRRHPVLVCGMASSNIGMCEIEYANIPFDFHGSTLKWRSLMLGGGIRAIIISGVKGDLSMMRGEETQAIGLSEHLTASHRGILLLPGTHSKHLTFDHHSFTGLKTFMTGELFQVISTNSILANSIAPGKWNASTKQAFRQGVELGVAGKLTASLFSIRAGQVLANRSKHDNFFLLSGMLIGDELTYLAESDQRIFVAAAGKLLDLYQEALMIISRTGGVVCFDEAALEHALLEGQKKILLLNEI